MFKIEGAGFDLAAMILKNMRAKQLFHSVRSIDIYSRNKVRSYDVELRSDRGLFGRFFSHFYQLVSLKQISDLILHLLCFKMASIR